MDEHNSEGEKSDIFITNSMVGRMDHNGQHLIFGMRGHPLLAKSIPTTSPTSTISIRLRRTVTSAHHATQKAMDNDLALPKRAPLLPDCPKRRLALTPPRLDRLHLGLLFPPKRPSEGSRKRSDLRDKARCAVKHFGEFGTAVEVRIGPSEGP